MLISHNMLVKMPLLLACCLNLTVLSKAYPHIVGRSINGVSVRGWEYQLEKGGENG